MPMTEHIGSLIYKDQSGNKRILFPKTKAECIQGLKEAIPHLIKLADLTEDSQHQTTTDTEKAKWNNALEKTGGTMSGSIDMGGKATVTNLPSPKAPGDAVPLSFFQKTKHITMETLYTGQLNPGSSVNIPGISKYTCILVRLGRSGGAVYGTPIPCYTYNGSNFRGSSGSCYMDDNTELFFVNAQIEKGDTLKLNAAKLYFMNNTTPPALTDWWNMYVAEIVGVF